MGSHLNLRLALYECKLALSRGISHSSLFYGRHYLVFFLSCSCAAVCRYVELLSPFFFFLVAALASFRCTHWEAKFVGENAICV